MSKRVFCSFDRDEIEGYLNGGLPVEILGWNMVVALFGKATK